MEVNRSNKEPFNFRRRNKDRGIESRRDEERSENIVYELEARNELAINESKGGEGTSSSFNAQDKVD